MNDQVTLLKIRFDGEAVGQGKIPVSNSIMEILSEKKKGYGRMMGGLSSDSIPTTGKTNS